MNSLERLRATKRNRGTTWTVTPSRGRNVVVKSYGAAIRAAMRMEEDRLCEKIEIFKAGTPVQWWTRNFITGEWDFHGLLFEGDR